MNAELVMEQVSRDCLGGSVLPLMMVGVWCSSALRMGWGMAWGMSASGMFVAHLACLLARRSRPYAAELNVGRVRLKEYGQVRRCVGSTSVLLVIGSSSISGFTG